DRSRDTNQRNLVGRGTVARMVSFSRSLIGREIILIPAVHQVIRRERTTQQQREKPDPRATVVPGGLLDDDSLRLAVRSGRRRTAILLTQGHGITRFMKEAREAGAACEVSCWRSPFLAVSK